MTSRTIRQALLTLAASSVIALPASAQSDAARTSTSTAVASDPVVRWAGLFAEILEEFRRDGRDAVANIEGDYAERFIRVRCAGTQDRWVSRSVTIRELEHANIDSLARQLYAATKARTCREDDRRPLLGAPFQASLDGWAS